MKKVVLILLSLIMISPSLSSIVITLINKEILSGIIIKQTDKKVYLSIDEDLYIIDNQVIERKNNTAIEENFPNQKINYNSFSEIHKITNKNIWNLELFSNPEINSISINDNIVPIDYNNKLKFITTNNEIIFGRYLGETDQEVNILVDSLLQVPKDEILEIWLISKHKKMGKLVGSIVGGLMGVSLGLLTGSGKIIDREDKKDSEIAIMAMISMVVGYGIGYKLGHGSASQFEKETLVWSRN